MGKQTKIIRLIICTSGRERSHRRKKRNAHCALITVSFEIRKSVFSYILEKTKKKRNHGCWQTNRQYLVHVSNHCSLRYIGLSGKFGMVVPDATMVHQPRSLPQLL